MTTGPLIVTGAESLDSAMVLLLYAATMTGSRRCGAERASAWTGLGLFIVRQIVERNKGRIAVESEVGKGTTLFLEFPSAREAAVLA
jgi:signal transduction histidine kinase